MQTILIADDQPEKIAPYIQVIGTEFEVVAARGAAETVQRALELTPDMVILELNMEEQDGIDICSELRRHEQLERTLIVLWTGNTDDYSQIAAFSAGADDYVSRSLRPRVFLSRIKALLRRRQTGTAAREFRGLRIDREKYMIGIEGKDLAVPRKEFELLALLTSEPGKVFTRNQIAMKVWGGEFVAPNRTIDVHIRKLREKIGSRWIKTIKGVGYSFQP